MAAAMDRSLLRAFTYNVYSTLSPNRKKNAFDFPWKQYLIMMMWFLLSPNKHVPLCLENVIYRLGHLCSTTQLHLCSVVTHFTIIMKYCCSWDLDIALGHIAISACSALADIECISKMTTYLFSAKYLILQSSIFFWFNKFTETSRVHPEHSWRNSDFIMSSILIFRHAQLHGIIDAALLVFLMLYIVGLN